MLKIKNTVVETKNTFDGLLTRGDVAEKNVYLEFISIETSKMGKQRKGRLNPLSPPKPPEYPRTAG